ncbi:DUF6318 family protein [Paeniglutamicibacter terrestris]|uniref:DUF6318 domain-containing protein n=1 Tax=Paeniglutamicibacter terrestris TaxID=2723403 RepID=A0ABX1G087_9MICC|nr:DUF6318 family protein [Paeniglutamicibacter terrestris]NKG19459.1 hypothetical protein [Paeniglutamicibacter terrestris]
MVTKIKKVSLIFCSAALVFAAAGCVGSADPVEPTPTASNPTATASSSPPTTSSSPSIKPTPKPIPASSTGPAKNWPVPVMPDAAKKNTEAGIKAFTEHYYELVEYTIQTNDTKPIKKVSKRTCLECGNVFIDPFDNNKKAGSWMTGAEFNVTVTRAILQLPQGISLYTTTQGEMNLFMSDGTLQGTFPATPKPAPLMMILRFDRGWMVESVEYLDEDS